MNSIYFLRMFFLVNTTVITLIPLIKLSGDNYSKFFLILLPYNFLAQIFCSLSLSFFYHLKTRENNEIDTISSIRKKSIPFFKFFIIAIIFVLFVIYQYFIGVFVNFSSTDYYLSLILILFSFLTVKPYLLVYYLKADQIRIKKTSFILPLIATITMLAMPSNLYVLIFASLFSTILTWVSLTINEKIDWIEYDQKIKTSYAIPAISSIILDYFIFPLWASNISNFREAKFLYSNIKLLTRVNIYSFEEMLILRKVSFLFPVVILSFLSTLFFVNEGAWGELLFISIVLSISVWSFKLDEIKARTSFYSIGLLLLLFSYVSLR